MKHAYPVLSLKIDYNIFLLGIYLTRYLLLRPAYPPFFYTFKGSW